MKTFRIDFTSSDVGYVYIKADSLEDAEEKFNSDDLSNLNPRYVDGSVSVDSITEQD